MACKCHPRLFCRWSYGPLPMFIWCNYGSPGVVKPGSTAGRPEVSNSSALDVTVRTDTKFGVSRGLGRKPHCSRGAV